MIRQINCGFVLLSIACAVGCNPAGLHPVEGVVLLDGNPVPNASIQFIPQGPGQDATGGTNEQGEFAMSTNNPRDGVKAGKYKVVITPRQSAPPQKFASADEAMKAAATARPMPPASNFPQQYTRAEQTPLTQEVPVTGKKVTIELKSN